MGAGCCKEEAIDFNAEIELSHFHLLRSVGKGAFGKVRVVQHKKTKEVYALKYINKAKCIRMRAIENIIQERRLLEEVEFPLICNLRYAFQDDENLFMVLDLMLGGDLRFHLERAGPMREDVVRFYVAELALALDALHARKIIHRDLKPDNVLLDEYGHAHLTDFNIAVYYNPAKPLMSKAGSMAYMAPEVLLRKGYLQSVDWWSLGVVMFELLFGKRPFRGKSNDMLTNAILRAPLPFPANANELVSDSCLDVLSKLCERDISKRLGCTPEGIDGFKKHPWFQGIEWDKLVTKEATPPFEPDSKRANFDATHELEELLMEDNPLKAKKRVQATPETELSIEMQMMEDKFLVYDFTKVKRPQSFNRPMTGGRSLIRTGSAALCLDNKMSLSSSTLNGNPNRHSAGRIDIIPMNSSSTKVHVYRPDSPSDLVGQKRFNPDEDQISLISLSEASNYNLNGSKEPPHLEQNQEPFLSAEAEKAALQLQDQQQQEQAEQMIQQGPQESVQDNANSVCTPCPDMPVVQEPLRRQSSKDQLVNNDAPRIAAVSSALSGYTDSITPSSPNSSECTAMSTPCTTYSNSPATHKGTALFATLDSGTSLSTMANPTPNGGAIAPLLDPASIPTPPTLRSRALMGRQPSQSVKGGRAFELSSQAQLEKQQHGHSFSPTRPMSAYTASNAGSIHETMVEFQESKSIKLGYLQGFRASILGIDDLSGLGMSLGSFDGIGFGQQELFKVGLDETRDGDTTLEDEQVVVAEGMAKS
ncbi:kinase-like domain-containing protein [Mortierella sp. GBAus27b]|nr:hypothetical protein BGX31_004281 [Mortierella sp. GBA43]KAI8361351.1 kinase-like domain-containing protein [Mortierella sp. GBAus27b]